MLTMLEEDRKSLNRYRLNYYCLTSSHHRAKAKEDLIKLARHLMSGYNNAIDKFEQEYNVELSGNAAHEQALQWAFRDSFFF